MTVWSAPLALERERLALQATLDSAKAPSERNRLGQFATPTGLAKEIVSHAVSLLEGDLQLRFLDPAIGTGAFYSALLTAVPSERVGVAQGFEIDPHYSQPARALWSNSPLSIVEADFTTATPPRSDPERFNLVVCNPPYVRHHHLPTGTKRRLQSSALALGSPMGGLAGLYCFFMALCHPWMRDGAVGAWLVPSEFMDVNYGRAVKRYLLDRVRLLRIHRFDPADVQFGDALVSSAVVFFRNEAADPGEKVEFTYGGPVSAPTQSRKVSRDDLRGEAKWSRYPVSGPREHHSGPVLKDFFSIRRGVATGQNSFFVLSAEEIDARGLPWQFFRPVLPSPRFLETDEIRADGRGHPVLARRLFLLDCRLPEEEVRSRHPALWQYLETGIPDVADRYLCRNRSPWYRQEDRPAAPLLCTYIGRADTKRGKPFRFILNHSQATAANTYLMLYPRPSLAAAMADDSGLVRRIWDVLAGISPGDLLGEGRVYGGGMNKLEPKELANVPAEQVQALLPATESFRCLQGSLF